MIWMLIVLGAWTSGFAAFNYRAVRQWRDSWEWVRWTPTIILGLWELYLLIVLIKDPTSHNLWPLELLGITVLSLIALAVVAVAYDARTRWKRR